MFTIEARNIYTPKPIPGAQVICIDQDRISHIGQTCDQPDNTVFSLSDFDVVPGFIEIQINGAFGKDFSQEPSAIWDVGARLLELGITTFLPTIITSPVGAVQKAMAVWQAGPPAGYRGAHIPGLHLEGPYLNPLKKGAHREQFFRQPALSEISTWTRENGVRMVTIAPELPGALSIIRALASRGILVSAGHSMATAKEMAIAIEAGIQCGTHIFNAMRPLDHREPGIAGILLSDDRLKVGIIVDGVHISPEIIKVIYRSKGETGFFLVSDAMAALGMSPGKYQLASREVRVNEKSALLENDILAGSIFNTG